MADEQKHAGGRPLIFGSAEDITAKAEEYFVWIRGEREVVVNDQGEREERWKRLPEPPTITGLMLYLGFESRQSFYDYAEKGQFSYALQRIRLMIECKYEQNLHGTTPTGSIFALKNMGWKDKTETDLNLHSDPIQIIMPPDDK
jgi:hypothetical protein